jgi:hypothetical protein
MIYIFFTNNGERKIFVSSKHKNVIVINWGRCVTDFCLSIEVSRMLLSISPLLILLKRKQMHKLFKRRN